ncbi:MAG: neutral/alkaline non-lysosomal ceramidase N-terminal domain-containing protein [Oscillospiraceae bacterium]|nr:neutral/alkaline non-lysosomal ceramidase N-terminal domain-containing protein [Oscillospiraceae bacterium]
MFKFGVAKRDITPLESMVIPGYFEKRFVKTILDPLYAKAMVFENDGAFAVAVVCDAINLYRDDVLRIRRGISEKTGIAEKYISVSATHTHTGGPTWDWNDAADHDPLYLNMLVDAAVEAGAEAFEKREEAKIGFAKCEVPGYSFIRRFKMKNGRYLTNPGFGNPDIVEPCGTPDNSFIVGKVCNKDGKLLAFISNFGVHLDMMGGYLNDSSKVSADYAGYLAKLVKDKYGEDAESVFFTGPCGNTNHNDFTKPMRPESDVPTYQRTAKALFEALCKLEEKIVLSDDVKPVVSREFLSARLRVPTKEYVETAQAILRGENVKFMNYGIEAYNLKQRRHIALATMDAFNNPIKMIDVEVMTLTLGDSAIVTWPAEVFVEYGKAVREKFADKNIIIAELSNGSFGCYLPTEEAIEQGGYEPTITGATTPEPKIGTDMVSATIDMLNSKF